MDIPPPPDVAGFSLDGDRPFIIPAEENAALCRSTYVAPAAGTDAHHIYYYIATQLGMGSTVEGICDACEFDLADGPLMAGTTVTFHQRPQVETPYLVRGEILGLTRKTSRKLGIMDLLEYRLTLYEGERLIIETVNRWFLPRKAAS